MNPRKVRFTGRVAAALALVFVISNACADLLEDARLCAGEPRRLERLACFDEVFGTPVAATDADAPATVVPAMGGPKVFFGELQRVGG